MIFDFIGYYENNWKNLLDFLKLRNHEGTSSTAKHDFSIVHAMKPETVLV